MQGLIYILIIKIKELVSLPAVSVIATSQHRLNKVIVLLLTNCAKAKHSNERGQEYFCQSKVSKTLTKRVSYVTPPYTVDLLFLLLSSCAANVEVWPIPRQGTVDLSSLKDDGEGNAVVLQHAKVHITLAGA